MRTFHLAAARYILPRLNAKVPNGDPADLQQRRTEIFRGLTLINSLNLGIVVLVAALGIIAIWLGLRAREDAQKLWNASATQARAIRFGGEIGWRSNALQTISRASEVRPSLALRNEAIAALSTPDIELTDSWQTNWAKEARFLFSPDLKWAALGSLDGVIKIIEMDSSETARELKAPLGPSAMAFDNEAEFLGARDWSGALRVWARATGEQILDLKPAADASTYNQIAFAGKSVVIVLPGGKIQLIPVRDQKAAREIQLGGSFSPMMIDPSGKKMAVGREKLAEIWDLESGQRTHSLPLPLKPVSLALTEGAECLAAGGGDMNVYLWRDKRLQVLSAHQGAVFNVAFNSTGSRLVSCAFGGTTRIWDVASGSLLMGTENLFVERFGLEPDAVACSRTEAGFGRGRLADPPFTRSIRLPGQENEPIHVLTFLDENLVAVSRTGAAAQIVDLESGRVITEAPGARGRGVVLNRKDRVLYTAGGDGLRKWPVTELSSNQFKLGPPETIQIDKAPANEALRIAPDDSQLLVRIGLAGVALVDLENHKTLAFYDVPNIGAMALSPDKKTIVTGTFHGEGTKVWNPSGVLITNLGGRDADVLFSPDGKWLAAVSSDFCKIYDTATWNVKSQMAMQSATGLPAVSAFSPDGRMLAFTVMRRTVKLMDMATGSEIASLALAAPQLLNGLAFSPNGNRLIAATQRGTLEIWELGALHQSLAALKLDWPLASQRPRELAREENILNWIGLLAAVALLAVLAYSLFSWARHRQFVCAYRQIEAMIEQRNEQLAGAQRELFQSQKMQALGTLAAGVAHDFNNLLSVIRLSNQLTTEATTGNSDVQENTQIIDRAIVQGKTVVRSMLGYSRNPGDQKEYSVPEVIEQTVALLRQQFLEKIEVRIEISADVRPVLGTQNYLEQALLNLIVNAVEAMKGDGRLRIAARMTAASEGELFLRPGKGGPYVEMLVADSGPGIPVELLPRIFEPFFTTKNVGKERGTGLGLSLVYGICQEEGIGIAVQSQVGAGTEFRLFIPLVGPKSKLPSKDAPAIFAA